MILEFEYLLINVGGLGETLTSIAEGLSNLGHEVVVFTLNHGKDFGKSFLSLGVRPLGRGKGNGKKIAEWCRGLFSRRRVLGTPDVYAPVGQSVQKSALYGKVSVWLMNELYRRI